MCPRNPGTFYLLLSLILNLRLFLLLLIATAGAVRAPACVGTAPDSRRSF